MELLKRIHNEQYDVFPLVMAYYLWIWHGRLNRLHFELRARTKRIRWHVEDRYGYDAGAADHVYMHCFRIPIGKSHHYWAVQPIFSHQNRWCDLHWPLIERLDRRAREHAHSAFCCYP